MNTWLRLCLLLLVSALQPARLVAQEATLKDYLERVEKAAWKVSTPVGVKLEAVRVELSQAWELVPKVPIEEQNLYMAKGLPAIFHYGNMVAVAETSVDDLITMEEMFAIVPEGQQKKLLGERLASAYRGARDRIMLPLFVGVDFEHAGKLKDDEGLREAVEKIPHVHDAFQAICIERIPSLTDDSRERLEKMFQEVKRAYEGARQGKPLKNE
jgi:hypothetical protein